MKWLSSLLSAVAPALMGKPDDDAPDVNNQTLVMGNEKAPLQNIEGDQGEATWVQSAARDARDEIIKSSVGALGQAAFAPIVGAAQGKANRKFADEAFPGLNPWERAGANTSAGGAAGAVTSQIAAQERNFQYQAKLQRSAQKHEKQQLQTQIENNQVITAMNNRAAMSVAGINTGPAYERLPFEIDKLSADAHAALMRAEVSLAEFDGLNTRNRNNIVATLGNYLAAKASGFVPQEEADEYFWAAISNDTNVGSIAGLGKFLGDWLKQSRHLKHARRNDVILTPTMWSKMLDAVKGSNKYRPPLFNPFNPGSAVRRMTQ